MRMNDFDWEGFRALVGRLDALLTGELADPDTFAEDCRRTLAFLYTAGVSMPTAGDVFEEAGGDAFWERAMTSDAGVLDPEATEERITDLAEKIGVSVDALQPDEVDGDADEEMLMAASNLWEAHLSLAVGAAHYDAKRLNEAAWEWSFGFDDWGGQALLALTGLHDVLWGVR